jgi:hypothetical protein
MAMLGLPTSAAEPEHAPMPGSDRVGAQPRARRPTATLSAHQPTRDGEAMLTDFYVAFVTVCFTLLGLWIIVVQTRHAEWRQSPVHSKGPDPAVVTSTPADMATTSRRGFLSACVLADGAAGIDRVLYIQWSTPR